jgi:predicted secreted protein
VGLDRELKSRFDLTARYPYQQIVHTHRHHSMRIHQDLTAYRCAQSNDNTFTASFEDNTGKETWRESATQCTGSSSCDDSCTQFQFWKNWPDSCVAIPDSTWAGSCVALHNTCVSRHNEPWRPVLISLVITSRTASPPVHSTSCTTSLSPVRLAAQSLIVSQGLTRNSLIPTGIRGTQTIVLEVTA